MTSARELLEQVVARPDDDELRLVFADWLEEHGELDRATFVREEIALAEVPKWDPRWTKHWTWAASHRDTAAPRPPLPDGLEWHPFAFDRGFPARLKVRRVDALLSHGAAVFAESPIQAIEIERPEDFEPLLGWPLLARIERLRFALTELGAEGIRRLDDCEHLRGLEAITFEFGGIAADGLAAFLHSRLAQRMKALGLRANYFVVHGAPLQAFAEAPALPALKRLKLEGNRLNATVLRAILDAKMPALADLSLEDNPLGDEGWTLLAENRFPLHALDISRTHPRVAGARALAASRSFATLEALDIHQNQLGPTSARVLAASKAFPRLRFLDAHQNKMGDAGVAAIRAAFADCHVR
ncbi:MAG: TIGR02996 domain-containing protein [Polyangiales bacterium]